MNKWKHQKEIACMVFLYWQYYYFDGLQFTSGNIKKRLHAMVFYIDNTFILMDCHSQFLQYDITRKILSSTIDPFHDQTKSIKG